MHASYSMVLKFSVQYLLPMKSGGRTIRRNNSVGRMEDFRFLRAEVSQKSHMIMIQEM